MAWRVQPLAIAGASIVVLLLMYRSARLDMPCDEAIGGGERWRADSSSGSEFELASQSSSTKSVSQFLREKVAKGVFDQQHQQQKNGEEELRELDVSTRDLLSKVVLETVAHPSSPGLVDQEKLFDLNYGVMRVIRRLVVCSSYRTSLTTFSLITLSPEFTVGTSNPDYKDLPIAPPSLYPICIWLEDGSANAPLFPSEAAMNQTGRVSVRNGEPVFRWMDEVHGTSYDTVMIHCTFPEPVGATTGGYLYMNISHGPLGTGAPSELVPVFHEKPSQLESATYYEGKELKYEYAYCSCPSFTKLIPAHVKQFLMYNYELLDRNVHFFFYKSAPIEDDTMAVLQPLVDAGVMTIVDFSGESNYHIMYHGQAPAINDCLYRSKFIAKWALFWDLDEYLFFPTPTNVTVKSLLKEHKNAPWISFGKIDFKFSHCSNATEEDGGADKYWAVERMVYREERPFCFDKCAQERCGEMCKAEKGMRKWIANPRKVKSAVTHSISDPRGLAGVAIHTDVGRFNHYRALVAPKARNSCKVLKDTTLNTSTTDSDGKTPLVMDDDLATFVVSSSIKSKAESLKMFGGTQ